MIRPLRVMTWNVNGLRAVLQRLQKSLKQFLDDLDADIICLQETKLTRSELDEELVRPPGYDAFYTFCRIRGGYSGVVTFCKSEIPTVAAEEGLTGFWPIADSVGCIGTIHKELSTKDLTDLESEGRSVVTDHQAFVLVNVYCPALASSERLEFKMHFHALLQDRVLALRAAGRHVVVVGDINVAHRAIDHCNPGPCEGTAFEDQPHRQWMNGFVIAQDEEHHTVEEDVSLDTEPRREKLVDTFRHFHPSETKAFTCWNTLTGARQTNYGTRIDYILVDSAYVNEYVTGCSIEPSRLGSDHCPVVMDAVVQLADDPWTTAALCAKNYAEFAGTQQSIAAFLTLGSEGVVADQCHTPLKTAIVRRPSTSQSKVGQRSITSFFTPSTPVPSKMMNARIDGTGYTNSTSSSSSVFFKAVTSTSSKRKAVEEWQSVLSGRPPPTPNCYCGQPTVLRSVVKINENWGRKFFVCTKPAGEKGHPDARCEFFQWADKRPAKRNKQ